jgi:ribonucleoside-diphosphate reductase alpha chain
MPVQLSPYQPFLDGFDNIPYATHDARITAGDQIIFEQRNVAAPATWSQRAINITAQKYLRMVPDASGTLVRETSIPRMIERVVGTLCQWGIQDGYFDPADAPELQAFRRGLSYLLLSQRAAFNSPVYFNLGVVPNPLCSACFIVGVDDNMDSILDLVKVEGTIFKRGAGSGLNASPLRSSKEPLSGGGTSSGPVAFMRGFDSMCGVVKAGGTTRRAAVMRVLDDTHLDLLDFIWCKAHEERKGKALQAVGYEASLDRDLTFWQNSNISVRVTDAFMKAATTPGATWTLRGRHTPSVTETHDAATLLRQIAEATYECGDPGMQFHNAINLMHTCPSLGPQVASNPCGEFLWVNWSACNLASINLLQFYDPVTDTFDVLGYQHAIELMVLAQDLIASHSVYPDDRITQTVRATRTIGLGFSNLGALLLNLGLPYDSPAARVIAGALTAILTGTAYRTSQYLAGQLGAFPAYADPVNQAALQQVLRQHETSAQTLGMDLLRTHPTEQSVLSAPRNVEQLLQVARTIFTEVRETLEAAPQVGMRHAQVTVLAPTGTISLMMDCDTTGIEPAFRLGTTKTLVGGGTIKASLESLPQVLRRLGYDAATSSALQAYVIEHGDIDGASQLRPEHRPVFATAIGTNTIAPAGHVNMLAAVQPFLSGGISKTINVPQTATVDDIVATYVDAWRKGLKSVTIYRDGSKGVQPLAGAKLTTKFDPAAPLDSAVLVKALHEGVSFNELRKRLGATPEQDIADYTATRWRLPEECYCVRYKFQVGNVEGYLHVGMYPGTNRVGEIFIRLAKVGSTLAGLLDSFAISVSNQLQHGVPLEALVRRFKHTKFEPAGITGAKEKELKFADSIIDHIFRWLELRFITARSTAAVPMVGLRIEPQTPTRYVAGMLLLDEDPPRERRAQEVQDVTRCDSDDEQADTGSALHDELSEMDSDGAFDAPPPRSESTGDMCTVCGAMLHVTGTCKTCDNCGTSSGGCG